MPAIERTQVQIQSDEGVGITLQIPVGEIVEPTERAKALFEGMTRQQDHWKDGTSPVFFDDEQVAREVCDAYDFYHGGHEVEEVGNLVKVWSLGYYVYGG